MEVCLTLLYIVNGDTSNVKRRKPNSEALGLFWVFIPVLQNQGKTCSYKRQIHPSRTVKDNEMTLELKATIRITSGGIRYIDSISGSRNIFLLHFNLGIRASFLKAHARSGSKSLCEPMRSS